MEKLDADLEPFHSTTLNRGASRDVVQFVPFNTFKGNFESLAKEVLKEIPK